MSNLALLGTMPEILQIEQEILKLPQVECPLTHYHIDGVYARRGFIPAGTMLTGAIHKFESISILAQGTLRITNGNTSFVIHAPHVMTDDPGIKRLGFAETDCTFITIHKTNGKEEGDIRDKLICDTFEEFEQQLLLGEQLC